MSHFKERTEKNCLNCNTEVAGRFCQNCGQENLEPKESAWHLVQHFFSDITHFDGKFFSSGWLLFRRPGFLSLEYMRGRRASYLNPIRMYVFTSAVFFLVFFGVFNVKSLSKQFDKSTAQMPDSLKNEIRHGLEKDSIPFRLDGGMGFRRTDTAKSSRKVDADDYVSVTEYDSVQSSLPPNEKDGWLARLFIRRSIQIRKNYEGNQSEMMKELIDKFLHTFPYILFISLPLYALFLKLLYIRHKKFYYVDHGIFLIHLYVFTFLFFLLMIGLTKLNDYTGWQVFNWIIFALLLYGIYYAFRAMRNFYGQGRMKTLTKFLLFNLLCLISIGFLFVLFLAISVFRI